MIANLEQTLLREPPLSPRTRTQQRPSVLDFALPTHLEADRPPEARGLARDEVRLMVSYRTGDRLIHTRFRGLPCFLDPGDVVVINTSGTLPAALPVTTNEGQALELHLSTQLPNGLWTVELRRFEAGKTVPFYSAVQGESLALPGGARIMLLRPYLEGGRIQIRNRLWLADLELPAPPLEYLALHGRPIRYGYVRQPWPLSYYQTVYATEMGSAEMPSAGRAFTAEIITSLVAKGVQVAPLALHTGVASLEEHEPPYQEYYRLPLSTSQVVNQARANDRRVVAVGTTVVRALETMADESGRVHAGEGWTDLVVTRERGLRAVNALLTGLHEPKASHLMLLEALAGREHLALTYEQALQREYLWHEFGDLHLIL